MREEKAQDFTGELHLTRPKSPKFLTDQRMQLKEDPMASSMNHSDDEDQTNFKARPLNKTILQKPSQLPEITKRKPTTFEEFHLSRTNDANLRTKNILEAYEKEINALRSFKARPVDAKIMEKPSFEPVKKQPSKEFQVPFALQTDKRARDRTTSPTKSE